MRLLSFGLAEETSHHFLIWEAEVVRDAVVDDRIYAAAHKGAAYAYHLCLPIQLRNLRDAKNVNHDENLDGNPEERAHHHGRHYHRGQVALVALVVSVGFVGRPTPASAPVLAVHDERRQEADGQQGQQEGAGEERHPQGLHLRLVYQRVRVHADERLLEDFGILLHEQIEVRDQKRDPDDHAGDDGVADGQQRHEPGGEHLAEETKDTRYHKGVDPHVNSHEDDVMHEFADSLGELTALLPRYCVVHNGRGYAECNKEKVRHWDVEKHQIRSRPHSLEGQDGKNGQKVHKNGHNSDQR